MPKEYHSFRDYVAYQNKNVRPVRRNSSRRSGEQGTSQRQKSQSDKDFLTTLIEFVLLFIGATKLLIWGIYSSLREMSRTPLTSLFNSFVIGLVLSIPSAGLIVFGNFSDLVNISHSDPHITLYVDSATQAEIQGIQQKLKQRTDIKSLNYVSKKQAIEEIQKDTQLAEIVSSLDTNPLPEAFVITPKSRDLKEIERLAQEVKKLSKHANVQIDSEWIKKIDAFLAFIQKIIVVSGIMMSGMVLVVIGNTIHLQILARKSELEICLLLGATSHFIQKPFIYFGITQGLIGGLIGGFIIEITLRLLNSMLGKIASDYALSFKLPDVSGGDVVFLLMIASILGGLGAYISVRQNLKSINKI